MQIANRVWPWAWRGVLLVFIAGPVAWAMAYALAYSLGGVGRLSAGWTTDHWQTALSEPRVVGGGLYSLLIAGCVTMLVMLVTFALLLAFPGVRHDKGLLLVMVVLLGTPALVQAQMVAHLIGPGGWVSRLAYHAGLVDSAAQFPRLVNDRFSVGLTLSISLALLPLAFLYFSQLWDAARIDGCCRVAQSLGATPSQTRCRVALPLLIARGKSMLLLLFIMALGSYEIPLLLGRLSPQMVSVATQQLTTGFDLALKPQGYVLASLYLICTSLMLAVFIRSRRPHD